MVGTAGEELIKGQYDVVPRKGKLSIKRQGIPYLVIWWDAIARFSYKYVPHRSGAQYVLQQV